MQLQLTKTAFWDVDINSMDETKHAEFIIVRIFQYGLMDDIKKVLRFYSPNQIKEAFKHTRGVDKKAIALASVAIGVNENELI